MLRHLMAVGAGMALIVGCTESPPDLVGIDADFGVNNGSGPSARGHASLIIAGELQTTSFNAQLLPNGRAHGHLENKSRGQDHRYHGRVDCLVVDGNTARFGGVITDVTNEPGTGFPIIEGSRFWVKVRDNGEGAASPVDQYTDVFVNLGNNFACQDFNFPFQDIVQGNIQVTP